MSDRCSPLPISAQSNSRRRQRHLTGGRPKMKKRGKGASLPSVRRGARHGRRAGRLRRLLEHHDRTRTTSFAAGTVAITDNDSNTAMYNVRNQKPGDTLTRCIRVTYTGTLACERAPVHAEHDRGARPARQPDGHAGHPGRGTTFPNCTGFTADGGRSTTARCRASPRRTTATRTASSTSRCRLELGDQRQRRLPVHGDDVGSAPDTVQGATTGQHTYTWEAQNQ